MIRADFCREGERLRLTMQGHAEYSGEGRDVVCAAASGIFYALAGYLSNFHKDGVRINAIRSGFADISCDGGGEEAMRLTYVGLIQVALTYPGYLCVNDDIWKYKTSVPRDVSGADA